ncbi:acyl-CoA dehydrogenase family protein [Acidianus manzaensis]|uniref:Acyl-CoA dehydrogenase n=1 Tax=Acidianus manzaensis TaxID=282676 RepID=A0A1W6JWR5_9CREN|nr:acyl-CoA dehydrogenase family protein [Acidianus manzaensis]ARM74695.1 acyl-CoA dehydrogenase [Acidianus manzaensis]
MLLDLESKDEDLQLVLSSFSEAIARFKGRDEISLFNELKNIGVFDFIKNTSTVNSLLIQEFIGESLLPSIVSTSALLGSDVPATLGVKYFPDADKAEIIVTPEGMISRDKVKLIEVESPDPSVKMFKLSDVSLSSSEYNFDNAKFFASAQIIGHGIACMKSAINYSNSRIAFGKPIGSYEAIKHKIVDDTIGLELVRSRYLTGERSNVFDHAFRKAFRAILDSIQIHGGMGFTADLDLHLHLKRILLLDKALS